MWRPHCKDYWHSIKTADWRSILQRYKMEWLVVCRPKLGLVRNFGHCLNSIGTIPKCLLLVKFDNFCLRRHISTRCSRKTKINLKRRPKCNRQLAFSKKWKNSNRSVFSVHNNQRNLQYRSYPMCWYQRPFSLIKKMSD